MEQLPIKIEKIDIIPDTHKAYTLDEFSSFGATGSSLYQYLKGIPKPGGEGIYRVTFPQGFGDMTLSKLKGENAFIGSGITTDGSFKQARLTPEFGDPTQMFIAMALMSIQNKLNEIQETQREMLDFMLDVEESKLTGNLTILNNTIEDFKVNSEDASFIKQTLMQIGNIKREAAQSEELYKKQIQRITETEDSFHTVSNSNNLVNKLHGNMRNYHLAFYIRSYAEFIEFFLIENFTAINLEHIRDRFVREKDAYDALYSKCYKWAEHYLGSAFGRRIAPALKGFDELYAKGLSHIPGNFDRHFVADADRYISIDTQMERIKQDSTSGTDDFVDSLKRIRNLQDKSVDVFLVDDKIYIPELKEGE